MVSIVTIWRSIKSFPTNRRHKTDGTINTHSCLKSMKATKKHKYRNRFLVLLCAFLWLPLLFGGTALAHDPGLSAAEVRILADRIVAEVSFSPLDLERIQQQARSQEDIA